MIVAHRNSALLRRTIGTPAVIENDVFRTYADLLRTQGVATKLSKEGDEYAAMRLRVEAPGAAEAQGDEDELEGSATVRTLLGRVDDRGGDYPAVDEFQSLRRRVVPGNLRVFLKVPCQDPNAKPDDSGVPRI